VSPHVGPRGHAARIQVTVELHERDSLKRGKPITGRVSVCPATFHRQNVQRSAGYPVGGSACFSPPAYRRLAAAIGLSLTAAIGFSSL
jgi:hypothetical protein